MTEVSAPRLLDCFSGAGGAARGYQMAGFHVTGIDINPQKRYAGDVFIQGDALDYLAKHGHEYDAIHASPPCQRYTMAQNAAKNADAHPDLVEPVRALLKASGKPYVIENVVGAPLENAVTLCGLSFGLNVKRHRLFESNLLLLVPPCPSHDVDYFVIFGHEVRNRRHGQKSGRKNSIAQGREAMNCPWMTRAELSEAIPPAYTKFIGAQLMTAVQSNQPPAKPISPYGPTWATYGPSRRMKAQPMREVLAVARAQHPGKPVQLAQATFDALAAEGVPMAGVQVNPIVPNAEVWVVVSEPGR